MPNLTLSTDTTELVLSSSTTNDVLDLWLNQTHLTHYRYLQLDVTRNCCTTGALSFKVYADYPITPLVNGYVPYTPGGVTSTDAYAVFGLSGVDVDIVASARVYTNQNNPTTNVFEWVDITPAQLVSDSAMQLYFLLAGNDVTTTIEFTTVDAIIYTVSLTLNPGLNFNTGSNTLVVDSVIISDTPIPVIDYTSGTITFNTTSLGQVTTDNIILDGVYNIDISLVSSTNITQVDSINKFFDIKLTCIVTQAIAEDVSNNVLFLLLESLTRSNDCGLTVTYQCKLYDSLIRNLIQHGKSTEVKSVGCKCGC